MELAVLMKDCACNSRAMMKADRSLGGGQLLWDPAEPDRSPVPRPLWQLNEGRTVPENRDKPSHDEETDTSDTSKVEVFLDVVFHVRIWKGDESLISVKELVEWLEYMKFAGVQRFYMYDCFLPSHEEEECLRDNTILRPYFNSGYVKYIDWSAGADNALHTELQLSAYQDAARISTSEWRLIMDVDEYPFLPQDASEQFLSRLLHKQGQGVTQLRFANVIFGGNPVLPLDTGRRIERYTTSQCNSTTCAQSKLASTPPAFRHMFGKYAIRTKVRNYCRCRYYCCC